MPTQARNGVAAKPTFGTGRAACEMSTGRPDPDPFFLPDYTPKATAAAKQLCRSCPVREGCAEWVAGHEQPEGVYAAMAPKEREGLAALLGATGWNTGRVLRWFDDREALATAERIRRSTVTRQVARQIVGVADLERAQLVRRWAPELVDRVMAGEVSLRDAAVRAQAFADAPEERKVAA